jgi:hypothetical protein
VQQIPLPAWRQSQTLAEQLARLAWSAVVVLGFSGRVHYVCEEETRRGLKTLSGRNITAQGVQPQGQGPWPWPSTYLYGRVEPATGEHCCYALTHLNSNCFQVFLNLVSELFHDSMLIMQLAQAGAPQAKRCKLPADIILLC